MSVRRILGAALSALFAVGLIALGACHEKQTDAKIFQACSPDKHCAEPNICLSFDDDPKSGKCTRLCKKDADCPKGLRCTGRHAKHEGAVDTYCRKPVGIVGADCKDPVQGCQPGLRCFEGKCKTKCKTDKQCPDKTTRCVPILVDSLTASEQKQLYSVCLAAPQGEGKKCSDIGPFCARDHYCYEKQCLKGCTTDKDCGKRRICDGQIYLGPDADKRVKAKAKPDRLYCRKAARKGRPCHHNLHLSCVRGLTCVKFHCRKVRTVKIGNRCDPDRGVYCEKGSVCFEAECRRTCLGDEDCPQSRRRRRKKTKEYECVEKTVRKRKIKLCLQ